MTTPVYLFDGTYDGFLSAIFETFERKEFDARFRTLDYSPALFEEIRHIETDSYKASRIQRALKKQLGASAAHDCYVVFLSELPEVWGILSFLYQAIFQKKQADILKNYGLPEVITYHKILKSVNRERHRMKAFVRFKEVNDGGYYATLAPDFNVLPLIIEFFQKRYADQAFLLFDIKRNYGYVYDLQRVERVTFSGASAASGVADSTSGAAAASGAGEGIEAGATSGEGAIYPAGATSPAGPASEMSAAPLLTESEAEEKFQQLWKQYFKSTNIVERKNDKLHLQHVPKRYWNLLIEKQD